MSWIIFFIVTNKLDHFCSARLFFSHVPTDPRVFVGVRRVDFAITANKERRMRRYENS